MENLIILGNGFDRNFGLPTDYRKNLKPILQDSDSELFEFLDKLYFDGNEELWSDFESQVGKIKIDNIITGDIQSKIDLKVSDFYSSSEIYPYPIESELAWAHDIEVDNAINAAHKPNISEIVMNEYPPLEEVKSFVGAGFQEMISLAEESTKCLGDSEQFHFDFEDNFISFNYTHTLESLYPQIEKNNILHIHGEFGNSEDFIWGNNHANVNNSTEVYVEVPDNEEYRMDGYAELTGNYDEHIEHINFNDEEIKDSEKEVCEFFDKLNISMEKPVSSVLNDLENFLLGKGLTRIYVFGMSFGEVDLPYFEKINELYPDARWTISYYSNLDDLKDNTSKLSFFNKLDFIHTNDFKRTDFSQNLSA